MKHVPNTSTAPADSIAAVQHLYTQRRFSVEEYFKMAEAGILHENDYVELIDGLIVVREAPSPEHSSRVRKIAFLFRTLSDARRAMISTENPACLDRFDCPQPDVALLEWRDDFYAAAHPVPSNVLLAIEVAWTSAARDRQIKAPLYARTGIPEYWLVDLWRGHIEIYREPSATGYAAFARVERGATVHPQAFPELELSVDDILL